MSPTPWCIIGDFNDLLSQEDKKGTHPHPNWLCMGFRQAISDCNLTGISLEGHPFTWIKSRGTPHVIEERLDRAMASASWLHLFPNIRLSNLLASHSDHSPILLHCCPTISVRFNGSFRFENKCLKEPDLEETVIEGWGVNENMEMVDRVACCANKLRGWSKRKRVKFKEEIDACVREMETLRDKSGEADSKRYQKCSNRHATLLVQEEGYWKQPAKMHWLQEGDLNTRFFHMSASTRSKKKRVTKLVDEAGTKFHTQKDLCKVAKHYFDTLFKNRSEIHEPMHPDKSPGPDGFNSAFYQSLWELCGDDIFVATSIWLDRGYFPSSLNESNICLIPKCDNPTSMKDLRPISLCNVLYKLVSKVLANMLKHFLDKCVSQEQSAFVEGRSILDNGLIAIESWSITTRKGLRQGDPMSTYLFILVAEGLAALIHQVVGSGDIHGVRICRGAPEAPGQEINLTKSEVFINRNMSRATQEDLAGILGIRHVLGTGIYLGLPSMIGRSKKTTFSYIKDRIWKRTNSWTGRALSKAGKEIMIKSVLQAIPSYVMSMYILSASFIDDIEKMINAFWWGGGTANSKGIHWLAWERLACPKHKGGLGFHNFEAFNMAMVLLGCRWRIGGGDKIWVMSDPWLRGNGEHWILLHQPEGVYNLYVRDLIVDNYKAWNIAKICMLFSDQAAERIIATPLIGSIYEDKLVWEWELNGRIRASEEVLRGQRKKHSLKRVYIFRRSKRRYHQILKNSL
ncbi:hypothetical protein TSUD_407190 [Trifolium subterraneum]|uniref:Uncharacterized protein n=1 Tax=Trifolium subterraneum TaxID=3900 RepID=A0A2Z6PQE6_TRISU|nr:hypothetical protein TSUD_407190 [Trifolium subterraneum]